MLGEVNTLSREQDKLKKENKQNSTAVANHKSEVDSKNQLIKSLQDQLKQVKQASEENQNNMNKDLELQLLQSMKDQKAMDQEISNLNQNVKSLNLTIDDLKNDNHQANHEVQNM